jgi:hypothetical protein
MGKSKGNTYPMAVRMAFGISGSSERSVRLEIEDITSGTLVFEATLDAEGLMKMMSGGAANVPAYFTPNPERIGCIHQHDHWTIDAYSTRQAEAELAAESWRIQNSWDTVEVRRDSNGKWVITGRRWVAPEQQED